MAPPQLITDFMRLMLLLAPSAAIICLVLAGLSLRQGSVPDALIGGNFAKWMFWAIVFLTLPQLISWFPSFGVPASLPSGGIGTGWMATLQSDLANFVQNFCPDQARDLLCRVLCPASDPRHRSGRASAAFDSGRDVSACDSNNAEPD